MKAILPFVAGLLLLEAGSAHAATVLFCPFDSLKGWTVRSVGAASAAIVEGDTGERSAELRAGPGTVLLTRDLPLEAVAGSRLTVRAIARTEGVARGPQATSTAKIHLAVATPAGVEHFHAKLEGTSELHQEGFTADVPAEAERVVLNLGLEACSGMVGFDRLVVRNDRRGVYPIDLSPAANASHGQLALAAFPKGEVEWEGIPFRILDAAGSPGGDCFRLKGNDHPDWPGQTRPIPVGKGATAVYLFHAVLGGGDKSPSPCAMWTATFAGGHDSGLSVFEGRQIGPVGGTEDMDNWKVAWRPEGPDGEEAAEDDAAPVTFGVTRWDVYSDQPILTLSCRAYHGSAPVVLAVTVVEEPPEPEPEAGAEQFDEMGGGGFDERGYE